MKATGSGLRSAGVWERRWPDRSQAGTGGITSARGIREAPPAVGASTKRQTVGSEPAIRGLPPALRIRLEFVLQEIGASGLHAEQDIPKRRDHDDGDFGSQSTGHRRFVLRYA